MSADRFPLAERVIVEAFGLPVHLDHVGGVARSMVSLQAIDRTDNLGIAVYAGRRLYRRTDATAREILAGIRAADEARIHRGFAVLFDAHRELVPA